MKRFAGRGIWILAISLICANSAFSDVRLPMLVGDNMVLQRDTKLIVWGWADPGEKVKIVFQNQLVFACATFDGRWQITIGPYPAGGPFEMAICGKNSLKIQNILIGDVWLASGQSNMEFPLKSTGGFGGVIGADKEAAGANYPLIRLLKVHHKIALRPTSDLEADGWTSATPESVGGYSAVAYLFGRALFLKYKVPIGLIEASWGGTVAESWVSEASLSPFPEFRPAIAALKKIDEAAATGEYERYKVERSQWEKAHSSEDRGRIGSANCWAGYHFDARGWPSVKEPQTKPVEDLMGFEGRVWLRKEVILSAKLQGMDLKVVFPYFGEKDELYFNGQRISELTSRDDGLLRDFSVPGKLVRAGRNVIALRLFRNDGWIGFFSFPENSKLSNSGAEMRVVVGGDSIPLAGEWSYQPGPDISSLPKASTYTKLRSDPNTATLLFNGMIAPLGSYKIRGVIWYQGEANAIENRSAQYRTLFPALIQDWRKLWGYEMPFLFVQLAGFGPNESGSAEYPLADLREAQCGALLLPRTAMATAVDIGDERNIHPRDKQDLASRLFLAAAGVAYGEKIVFSGPSYRSMAIESNRIRIRFLSVGSGLMIRDKHGDVRGFEIAGNDQRFVRAQATLQGNDLLVWSQKIERPSAVRYDWSNTPEGNVYNKEGLPAIPFRTNSPPPN